MRSHYRVVVLATVAQFIAISARAQAADTLTKGKADGSIAVASATPDTSVHKKHGMFGKLKSVAQNKTVQNITKAAICTAVPGGQYMVGAAEAAKNKTSVASGVANAQSCIPGMPGAGMAGVGGMGGMPGMGGVAGVGGKGMLANAAMGAAGTIGAGAIAGKAAPGAKGLPGVPGMPGVAGIAGMPGMPKLPGGGRMTAAAAGIAGVQAATEQMKMASIASGGTGGAEMTTEASGEQMKLSGAVPDEIKKGKLVIKKIDWVRSNPSVSPSTTQGFMDMMLSAGQAMKAAGGNYRVDIYMDKHYSDEEIATLGAQRQTVIVSSLQAGGQLADAVIAGKIGKDKEQRVEIVKVK